MSAFLSNRVTSHVILMPVHECLTVMPNYLCCVSNSRLGYSLSADDLAFQASGILGMPFAGVDAPALSNVATMIAV